MAEDALLQRKARYLNCSSSPIRAALCFVVWACSPGCSAPGRGSRTRPRRVALRGASRAVGARHRAPVPDHRPSRPSTGGCRSRPTGSRRSTACCSSSARRCRPCRSRSCCWRGSRTTSPSARRCSRSRARSRQAAARLHDALGLRQLLAVPDHLVRQPAARRRPSTSAACTAAGSRSRRSCWCSTSRCRSAPAVAAAQAQRARARGHRRADARDAGDRPLLAGRPRPRRPRRGRASFRIHWLDLAALLGLGGLWLALFARQALGRPLLPAGEPELPELAAARAEAH